MAMLNLKGTIHNDSDFPLPSVSDSHVGPSLSTEESTSVDDLTSIAAPKLPTDESILDSYVSDIDDRGVHACVCQRVSPTLVNWTCDSELCSPRAGEDKENWYEWLTRLDARQKLDANQVSKLLGPEATLREMIWHPTQKLHVVEIERQRDLMLRVQHPQMREPLAILQNLGDVRQQQLEKLSNRASVPCIDTRVPPAATHRSSLASDRPNKSASLKFFVSSTIFLDRCVSTANDDRTRNNLGLTGIHELDIAWLSILDQSQARTLPEYDSQFATLLEHSTIDALVRTVHTRLSSADCIRLIDLLHEVALSL